MFKDISEDEKELYLDVLREGTFTPFNKFVSRGDLPDVIDIANPRKEIDRNIFRAIKQTNRDKSTRLIPILGSAGSGKTHAFWAYKDKIGQVEEFEVEGLEPINWTIVYVPSPPASVRVLFHIYTCIIEELGADVIKTVSEKLVTKWGGKKRGFFSRPKADDVISRGIREFPGVGADIVKALVSFRLEKDKRALAERWLLGEDLEDDELDDLGINSVIEDDDTCLAMIKIITENLGKVIVLYFDEIESPYRMHGELAERKFLEVLKKQYNEVQKLVIVIAVLKEIWPRILEIADQPLRSRMEPEQELKPFSLNDLKLFFANTMEHFWDQNNLNPPLYPLFPLNEEVINVIYEKSGGNPRDAIKLCNRFINKIINREMSLEELSSLEVDIVATSQPPSISADTAIISSKVSAARKKIEEIFDTEYLIKVNPASIAGAALKSIIDLGEMNKKDFNYEMEYKFKIGKREYTIAAIIEFGMKKWGLEIPSIKTFDRSGGVAAYYAAKRLNDAIINRAITNGILIVPRGTAGKKFSLILERAPEIVKFEINDEEGEELIRSAMRYPSRIGWEMAKTTFEQIEDYSPPEEESLTETFEERAKIEEDFIEIKDTPTEIKEDMVKETPEDSIEDEAEEEGRESMENIEDNKDLDELF